MGPQVDVSQIIEFSVQKANLKKLYCSYEHALKIRADEVLMRRMSAVRASVSGSQGNRLMQAGVGVAEEHVESPMKRWLRRVLRMLGRRREE
jgi:hypothetical protein